MVLLSRGSSLSIYSRKKTQYQKFLNLSNVFLLLVSTILIFSATILIKFYSINDLDFWSATFWITPVLMISLGVYTFFVCIFGFLISGSENRHFLTIFSVLLSVAFLAKLVSIFMSLELRNKIIQDRLEQSSIINDLEGYNLDPHITAKWDNLQSTFYCCGGYNYLTGYNDYRNTPIGANNSVPDSCCHEIHENCGKDVFAKTISEVRSTIFVTGCITLLKRRLKRDVMPMMVVYVCVGVLMALTEIITIVLASAYVAQISRKLKREEVWRIDNGPLNEPLTNENETVC